MTLAITSADKPDQEGELIPKMLEFLSKDADRLAQVLGHAAAGAVATTTTTDTGEVLDLTTEGIEFKTDTFYEVTIEHIASSDNDFFYQKTTQWVRGSDTAGTDPVLLGDSHIERAWGIIAGTVTKYGRVKFKTAIATGATTETADSASNVALGAFTSGTATLTLPVNRLVACTGANFAAATYGATTGAVPMVEVTDASTTGTVEMASPDDGLVNTNPADGVLSLDLEIWPPTNAFLSIDGSPDPGHVTVHILGVSSDDMTHNVKVYVSEGTYLGATA